MPTKSLTRSRTDKVIAGVAGGLAEYLGIDANIVRVVFVLAAIFLQFGWVVYVALWLFLPYADGGETGLDALKRQFSSGSGSSGSGTSS